MQAPEQSFSDMFVAIQAGAFDDCSPVTDELKRSRLIRTFVGNKVVCSGFGTYVKFLAEVDLNPQQNSLNL